ncbi:MAG: hypothetical protein ACLTEE_04840 [Anaerobutyricum hallii]
MRRYELNRRRMESNCFSITAPENSGKQGRPSKCNRTILNGIVWIARQWSNLGVTFQNATSALGKLSIFSLSQVGWEDGILGNIFREF